MADAPQPDFRALFESLPGLYLTSVVRHTAYTPTMVDSDKAAQGRIDELERMRQETQAILDASAKLMADLHGKLERMRRLRVAQEALLEQRRRLKEMRARLPLAQLLGEAVAQMRSDAASVQLLDGQKNELLLLGWKGFHPDSAAHWERVSVGPESTCGVALKERQRVIVADVTDPACGLTQEGIAYYKLSGLVAVQSTPLASRDGRLLGMLSTHWQRLHEPGEHDLARFDVLARQAADAIESVP